MSASGIARLLAALALPIAPVAALDTAAPNISTGDAIAAGPNAIENTGGNAELGEGHSESKVVEGPPAAAPTAAPAIKTITPPRNPAADALARAKALVDAEKAKAQALIDAARANAERAVEQAHQDAADAQARAAAQSDAARANAASAQANAAAD